MPETRSPGSVKIPAHAPRAASSGLMQRSHSAHLKPSPHSPETLPSSPQSPAPGRSFGLLIQVSPGFTFLRKLWLRSHKSSSGLQPLCRRDPSGRGSVAVPGPGVAAPTSSEERENTAGRRLRGTGMGSGPASREALSMGTGPASPRRWLDGQGLWDTVPCPRAVPRHGSRQDEPKELVREAVAAPGNVQSQAGQAWSRLG